MLVRIAYLLCNVDTLHITRNYNLNRSPADIYRKNECGLVGERTTTRNPFIITGGASWGTIPYKCVVLMVHESHQGRANDGLPKTMRPREYNAPSHSVHRPNRFRQWESSIFRRHNNVILYSNVIRDRSTDRQKHGPNDRTASIQRAKQQDQISRSRP